MKKAVILMSGGVDSTTVIAQAIKNDFEVFGLSILYGQKHGIEIESAKKVAKYFNIDHKIITINNFLSSDSALVSESMELESFDSYDDINNKIYSSYVPARNLILLSLALGYAESIGVTDIFYGPNKDDYHQYPDCREEFVRVFENITRLATKPLEEGKAYKIHTPLINLYKHQVVELGLELGVDYSITSSCYNPSKKGEPCGKCLSCVVRNEAFRQNNIKDPLLETFKDELPI